MRTNRNAQKQGRCKHERHVEVEQRLGRVKRVSAREGDDDASDGPTRDDLQVAVHSLQDAHCRPSTEPPSRAELPQERGRSRTKAQVRQIAGSHRLRQCRGALKAESQ